MMKYTFILRELQELPSVVYYEHIANLSEDAKILVYEMMSTLDFNTCSYTTAVDAAIKLSYKMCQELN